jgi:hypothetical protein
VIPDEVEERLAVYKLPGAPDCVAVSPGFGLVQKRDVSGMLAGERTVGHFIIGVNNNTRIRNPRTNDLFDDDAENRLLLAVAVDQGLKREMSLAFAGRSNDCFPDLPVPSRPLSNVPGSETPSEWDISVLLLRV